MINSYMKKLQINDILTRMVKESMDLVLYHASPTPFEGAFDPNRIGSTNDMGYSGRGFYFTPDHSYAVKDALPANIDAFVRQFDVKLQNPYVIDTPEKDIFSNDKESNESEVQFQDRMTSAIKDAGYDGTIRMTNGKVEEVVAFNPNTINPVGEWQQFTKRERR